MYNMQQNSYSIKKSDVIMFNIWKMTFKTEHEFQVLEMYIFYSRHNHISLEMLYWLAKYVCIASIIYNIHMHINIKFILQMFIK